MSCCSTLLTRWAIINSKTTNCRLSVSHSFEFVLLWLSVTSLLPTTPPSSTLSPPTFRPSLANFATAERQGPVRWVLARNATVHRTWTTFLAGLNRRKIFNKRNASYNTVLKASFIHVFRNRCVATLVKSVSRQFVFKYVSTWQES